MENGMELLKMLQEIRNPVLDVVFKFFTLFGEELVITAVICIMFWCVNKKAAYRIAFSFFASGLVIQGLKITFRVERPWIRDNSVVPIEGATKTATGYSFPSGHTQSGTSLFTCVAYFIQKKWAMVLSSIIIAGVMISRMYLGVHTPMDVGVSFVVTFLLTAVICGIYDKLDAMDKKHKKLVMYIMLGISLALIIYNGVLLKLDCLSYANAADCFKAAGAGIGFAVGWYIENEYIKFETRQIWWKQIIKLLIGVAVAVALKSLPKLISDSSAIIDVTRYFVTVMWITCVYPLIIKKCFK